MVTAAHDTLTAAARLDRSAAGWSAVASALLAYADLLAGDPAAARRRTEEVLAAAAPGPPVARLVLGIVHAAAVGDQGDRAAGLAESRAARVADGEAAAAPGLLTAMAVLEHRAAVLHPVSAAELVRWVERRTGRVGEVLLLEAWTHQAAGRHEAACDALAPLRSGAVAPLLPQTHLEAHLVHAEAALHVGDVAGAVVELDAALARGTASRTVRPFALAGPLTRELLPTRPAARGQGWFGARLAAALLAVHADTAPVLSERELVVLALLPSLLSGGEIADELMVSVNTVKSHIRSIYTKLGVSTRRDAVVRALEHGLLP
jgi:LuxR family maltose regulon positive regulatory protein